MSEELTLGHAGADELVIELPPQEEDEQDVAFQARARTAREPMFQDFHISEFKPGQMLEVFSPYYRIATVQKVRANSCIVECQIRQNQPRYEGQRLYDKWVMMKWLEVWALRTFTYTDTNRPGNQTWQERHVAVVQENRPKRFQATSPVLSKDTGPWVKAAPLKGLADAVRDQTSGEGQGVRGEQADGQPEEQEAVGAGAGKEPTRGAVRKRS